MGLFLKAAVVPKIKMPVFRAAMEEFAIQQGMSLEPKACAYAQAEGGVLAALNPDVDGYDDLAKMLSQKLAQPVLLTFIYDGDFWAYFLYDRGEQLDYFNPFPDYFGAVEEEEIEQSQGNSEVVSKVFSVPERRIENYLVRWTGEQPPKAYEGDEFGSEDARQMLDFLRALGFDWNMLSMEE